MPPFLLRQVWPGGSFRFFALSGLVFIMAAMKILVTADLHYDIKRSREPVEQLARRVCAEGGDVLVLVGDTAGADMDVFRQCLRLFADFPGRKLLVPGNHCLWCEEGQSSIERYEKLIPQAGAAEGFTVLDFQPVVLGGVGFVGSIGWYDYSLRDDSLGIPLPFYREKISPGAAKYYGSHAELLAAHAHEITERQLSIGTRWMDGWRVNLGMTDEEFLRDVSARLAGQLHTLAGQVERIVAFVHHLPFAELVPPDRPDRFAFAAAYLGAERLGEVLADCEKVTDVYCGHSHWSNSMQAGKINVVNVGSTYIAKKLEVLEI